VCICVCVSLYLFLSLSLSLSMYVLSLITHPPRLQRPNRFPPTVDAAASLRSQKRSLSRASISHVALHVHCRFVSSTLSSTPLNRL
jgi:hypothetical protein